jgi:spore maturation protein CgeB
VDLLRKNLAALASRDPDLARRLHLPVGSAHVRLPTPERPAALQVGRSWQPLGLDASTCAALLAPLPAGMPALLFGVGLGELLAGAVARGPVVAWDRDPWLLRSALAAHDLAAPLRSGDLQMVLAMDLLDQLPWTGPILDHPLLARIYRPEHRLLRQGPGPRRALLVSGELFVEDLDAALQARGYTVLPWEVARHAREELEQAARKAAAEVVVAVNYTQGLAEACAALALPLVCWEVDPATDQPRLTGPAGRAHVFTYRQANVPVYQAAGFPHVRYLPLATDPSRRQPPAQPPSPRHQAPISFVGSSMVRQSLQHKTSFLLGFRAWTSAPDETAGQRVLEQLLHLQRREPACFVVPDLLERLCPGWRAAALARREHDPALLVGEIAAAEKRLNTIAALGPLGIKVWGDDGWKLCARAGVEVAGPAGHGAELNAIYAGSRLNLDINRLYQPDIATMRIFDILACGGFVLAEHTPALEDLFDIGRELVTWQGVEDLLAKTRHYLAHPEEARRVAEAGRARVLAEHTVGSRLEAMLGELGPGEVVTR